MIKALMFDLGGVLLDIDMEKCGEVFREKAGFLDIDRYIDTFHQKGFWGDIEIGRIGLEEFINRCIEHSAPGTTRDVVFECFRSFIGEVPAEKVELIRELSGKYGLYMLSNTNPMACAIFEEVFPKTGFSFSMFRKCFFSFELKMVKPGREIYEHALKEIGLAPDEILFIDDSCINVNAASQLGIRTLLYDVETSLRDSVMAALDQ